MEGRGLQARPIPVGAPEGPAVPLPAAGHQVWHLRDGDGLGQLSH